MGSLQSRQTHLEVQRVVRWKSVPLCTGSGRPVCLHTARCSGITVYLRKVHGGGLAWQPPWATRPPPTHLAHPFGTLAALAPTNKEVSAQGGAMGVLVPSTLRTCPDLDLAAGWIARMADRELGEGQGTPALHLPLSAEEQIPRRPRGR